MVRQTTSERLQGYFEEHGLSMAQVSRDTGIQYDTIQQILYGRIKAMGVDKFAAIWKAYPDLDAWYILTGEPSSQTTMAMTVAQLVELKSDFIQSVDERIRKLGG